jgi:murein DD-endopeptidase MepM/ murein hydrolase activator NlpD
MPKKNQTLSNRMRYLIKTSTALITLAFVANALAAQPAEGLLASGVSAGPAITVQQCQHPTVPKWFGTYLYKAVKVSGDIKPGWARSAFFAKIACWQETAFDGGFRAHNRSYHHWHGIFAMTVQELSLVSGPSEVSNPNAFTVTKDCFIWGWQKCPHLVRNARLIQQLIVAMRFIWLNYGTPKAAWINVRQTGRFNSYPRPGTDNKPTVTPFAVCPVDGKVSYVDDFGQPRYVGGYHPHAGNDILAPKGRPIRAPFDGLASAHSGGLRGGNWVTVVGAKGYVQNDHLSAFGKLGFVKTGTIVGYVGMSGDAVVTHDHFEWHPWAPPTPLHVAPSGFSMVQDTIDPYPFINKVCTR